MDLIPLAESITAKTAHIKKPLKVAVMGCAVNGPGEAAAADIGITGGDGRGLLIRKGEVIRKVDEADLEEVLLQEIDKLVENER